MRLDAVDPAELAEEIRAVFAAIGAQLGVVAIGECTADDVGEVWLDEEVTSLDRIDTCAEQLRTRAGVSGLASTVLHDGTQALVCPSPQAAFSLFTAALFRPGTDVSAEAATAFGVLSAVVSSARSRAGVESELRERVAQHDLLSELSNRAATEAADDTTLQEMLEQARDRLGITAASTLVREKDEFVLVATTDYLGSTPVPPGTRVASDVAYLLELTHTGHIVRGLTAFQGSADSLLETDGEVLCVARFGPDGVEGMVVFTDAESRTWSPALIDAAKSIARSVQKLTVRSEAEKSHRRRHALGRMLSEVATVGAGATLDTFDSSVDEAMRLAIETLDIDGVGIWAVAGETAIRMRARSRDGRTTTVPTVVPYDAAAQALLVARGHAFVPVRELEVEDAAADPDDRVLMVPIGSGPIAIIAFSDPPRWWTGDEIVAATALGGLAEQTRARLHGDAVVHLRLRAEAFTSAVAAMAIDVNPETIDSRFDEILAAVTDHFGVVEASIWLTDGAGLVCQAAVRTDGLPDPAGSRLDGVTLDSFDDRGWRLVQLDDIDLNDLERQDPTDTKMLVTTFGGHHGLRAALVLNDPSRRWWNDESIGAARTVADILAQVQLRVDAARRLERQQSLERLLSEVSRRFVNATLADASTTVDRALEELRSELGLAGVTLLELDHRSLEVRCSSEVTADGLHLLREHLPVPRDHPLIARVLDPTGPEQRPLVDLFDAGEFVSASVLACPSVRGRDLLALLAVSGDGEPCDSVAAQAVRSMTGLLAQLRRRLLLETHSRRRAAADRLVASIATSFIDRPPEEHDRVMTEALARIGEFFDFRVVSRWEIRADGTAGRVDGWRNPAMHETAVEELRTFSDSQPLIEFFNSDRDRVPAELGARAPVAELASDTIVAQRLFRDKVAVGGLLALTAKPKHMIVDLDIQSEVLESVARLIEQLWRRAEAEDAVASKLHNEDLLRRFATRMVSLDTDDVVDIDIAFRELMASVGVDQATIWHFQPDAEGFEVTAALHAADEALPPLDERFWTFREPLGFTDPSTAPHFTAESTTWDFADAPLGLRRMVGHTMPAGPRQIGFFPAPGSHHLEPRNYLSVSRPGTEPFRADEVEFFLSAHSLFIQHEARVTAERWFGAAFKSAPIGITLREADSTLIHCNQAYCDLVDRSVEDLIGSSPLEVMSPEMASAFAGEFAADDGDMRYLELSYLRPDGTIRWATVRSTPVQLPGRREPLFLHYVEDITERRQTRELLEYQAGHDELTGLPNRRSLVAEISAELEQGAECAVLVLDLDRFKVVNDSLGHSVGDQLLITCADRIRLSMRPGDSVCRLGGDEFAVLLRAPADAHAAGVVAERLLALLRGLVTIGDDEVFPSASIGVALPARGDAVEDLLRHADAAMYQAKNLGRDRWLAFDDSMRRAVVDRVRTESDLRRAMSNGRLEVHYQPELLLETGEIVGSEALVRWRHPERGLLTAGEFIGLAEESGLIVDIGLWVLSQATMQGARWLADGHDVMTRVNLSARQLRPAVVDEVEDALSSAGLAPNRLCLELTETAIMHDVLDSARILARFRDIGVQVAIDDFGTGFSSLSYLKRLPVDILKIDRTFVDGVGADPDDTAIVRSIVGLARTLRLDVVAEGIENEAQVEQLIQLGCTRGQGFLLAHPAPADEVTTLLERGSTIGPGVSAD